MRLLITILMIIILNVSHVFSNVSFDKPRIGIVISKASYAHHWGITQMAAHGWGGVVNLAGIPYDCLFIEDINPENNLKKYDCLIFGQCKYVSDKNYDSLKDALKKYLDEGGNIILDGGLAYFDENARERDHSELDDLFNVSNSGFKGNSGFRIKIKENSHFITRQFEKNQYVTQHLVNGLHIQQVYIDDQRHFAYNEDVIILPNLIKPTAEIKIILGSALSSEPHLQYTSKRMPEIRKNGNDIVMKLLTKSKARFGFHAPAGYIVLNADWFEWNRKGNNRLNGYVTSDRTITFKQLQKPDLVFYHSDILISNVEENEAETILTLSQEKTEQDNLILFSSEKEVQSIHLNNQSIVPEMDGDQYILRLNLVKGENTLRISL